MVINSYLETLLRKKGDRQQSDPKGNSPMPKLVPHTDRGTLEFRVIGNYPPPRDVAPFQSAPPQCKHSNPEDMAVKLAAFMAGELNAPALASLWIEVHNHLHPCDYCRLVAKGIMPASRRMSLAS
jgi:hypothetical protein